jgi:hypothetical protein
MGAGAQFTCFTRTVTCCTRTGWQGMGAGAQFTCFTRTAEQMLTGAEVSSLSSSTASRRESSPASSL